MGIEGVAGTGPTGRSELDRRLEALVAAASDPVARAVAGSSPDEPVDGSTLEELVAELRGMREAFLSLPTLDVLEERLVAIEAAVDRLAEAVGQALDHLDGELSTGDVPAGEPQDEVSAHLPPADDGGDVPAMG